MRFKDSVCLVTGATGYIGSILAERLKKQGATVRTADSGHLTISGKGDVARGLGRFLVSRKFDFIFHLAAMTDIRHSWQQPRECFETNVEGTLNLLEALRFYDKAQRVPFAFTSSSSVYGLNNSGPITEGSSLDPISPYGVTKASSEVLCRGYNRLFGLQTRIARPFYVTGYGCSRGVVFEMARKIAIAEAGEKHLRAVEVDNPDVILDLVDVHDCVQALEIIALKGKGGEAYNVSTGRGHSIKEAFEVLLSFSSARVKMVAGGEGRPKDTPELVGDPSKLERLGWRRDFDFEATLLALLEYCRHAVSATRAEHDSGMVEI